MSTKKHNNIKKHRILKLVTTLIIVISVFIFGVFWIVGGRLQASIDNNEEFVTARIDSESIKLNLTDSPEYSSVFQEYQNLIKTNTPYNNLLSSFNGELNNISNDIDEKARTLEEERLRKDVQAKADSIEADRIANETNGTKIAYLTFDDGPSSLTPKILDVLDTYKIKATFFVVGTSIESNPEILKDTYNRGHGIANHSYSHVYPLLYSSFDDFMNEIHKNEAVIKNVLGQDFNTKTVRFPGGSYGHVEYVDKIKNLGYYSYDWNVLNGDGETNDLTSEGAYNRFIETFSSKNGKNVTILMHDTQSKQATLDSLPRIIEHLISQGYTFKTLS